MHYRFWVFTEEYASIPKYTPNSKSSRGKFLGLSLRDLTPFLIRLTRTFTFHYYYYYYYYFHFMHFSQFFIFSSHNHDANEMQ